MPAVLVALEDPSGVRGGAADHRCVPVLGERGLIPELLKRRTGGRVNRLAERPLCSRPPVGIGEASQEYPGIVAVGAAHEQRRAVTGKAQALNTEAAAI